MRDQTERYISDVLRRLRLSPDQRATLRKELRSHIATLLQEGDWTEARQRLGEPAEAAAAFAAEGYLLRRTLHRRRLLWIPAILLIGVLLWVYALPTSPTISLREVGTVPDLPTYPAPATLSVYRGVVVDNTSEAIVALGTDAGGTIGVLRTWHPPQGDSILAAQGVTLGNDQAFLAMLLHQPSGDEVAILPFQPGGPSGVQIGSLVTGPSYPLPPQSNWDTYLEAVKPMSMPVLMTSGSSLALVLGGQLHLIEASPSDLRPLGSVALPPGQSFVERFGGGFVTGTRGPTSTTFESWGATLSPLGKLQLVANAWTALHAAQPELIVDTGLRLRSYVGETFAPGFSRASIGASLMAPISGDLTALAGTGGSSALISAGGQVTSLPASCTGPLAGSQAGPVGTSAWCSDGYGLLGFGINGQPAVSLPYMAQPIWGISNGLRTLAAGSTWWRKTPKGYVPAGAMPASATVLAPSVATATGNTAILTTDRQLELFSVDSGQILARSAPGLSVQFAAIDPETTGPQVFTLSIAETGDRSGKVSDTAILRRLALSGTVLYVKSQRALRLPFTVQGLGVLAQGSLRRLIVLGQKGGQIYAQLLNESLTPAGKPQVLSVVTPTVLGEVHVMPGESGLLMTAAGRVWLLGLDRFSHLSLYALEAPTGASSMAQGGNTLVLRKGHSNKVERIVQKQR